jgi:hypothetical protein
MQVEEMNKQYQVKEVETNNEAGSVSDICVTD